MRILYYNWVDFLDAEQRGGGVTLYQKNVAEALEHRDDVDVVFLSSGIAYDFRGGAPYWTKTRNGAGTSTVPRFEIVNSGVQAPAHFSYGEQAQISDATTTQVFFDFIDKHGPFDVVHFNNLEGVPAEVLALKTRFPGTRVVLSLHNYYPICPQVNLWYEEAENCTDFEGGRRCEVCLLQQPTPTSERRAKIVSYELQRLGLDPGHRAHQWLDAAITYGGIGAVRSLRWLRGLAARHPGAGAKQHNGPKKLAFNGDSTRFLSRRASFVELINTHCDAVLGVSDRVCDVAERFGIDRNLLRTSYIGTKHAELWENTSPRPRITRDDGTIKLAFLGYMRRDKGYFFLARALRALPDDLAKRVRLLVSAKNNGARGMSRIEILAPHLKEVFYLDGYTHDQLDDLLADVDVGVIPVQWEDNLPQVAIEMHARHVPLLTSDLGGARELGRCDDMVFRADDIHAFHDRLRAILDGTVTTGAYWRNAQAPVSMEAHVEDLLRIYSSR
jgi:glycosyltransferase involved in cell wall biosynthesis